ncbi:MAG: hypothetical protein JWO60_1058 [Frankiales bacterium]|nr:hypothetical protein [Frankiales bacterium]
MRWPAAPVVDSPADPAAAVVLGAVLTGVVGYALALWFARASTWAERVEEEQYCGPAVPRATAVSP